MQASFSQSEEVFYRSHITIFFAEILHAGRTAIDKKHIKQNFSLEAWVRAPGVDLGGEQNGSKYFANRHTLLTQGVGSKGQTITFSESSHVAYQIKGH